MGVDIRGAVRPMTREAPPRAAPTFTSTQVRARRLLAIAVALGAASAVLLPTALGWKDSFPLSTYPMFTTQRTKATVYQLLGVAVGGEREPVPPSLLGTSEVMQAKVLIQRAARGGKAERRALCRDVAARAASSGREWRRVELVESHFEPVKYLLGSAKPLSRKRLFRCKVPRQMRP